MSATNVRLLFLNLGHLVDHLFMLIFATAVVVMVREGTFSGASYGDLIKLITPALIVFGAGAIPAGWIADRWSRNAMMVVFYVGIGCAAILTSFANTQAQLALGLFSIGVFAAVYHPVGIAMVMQGAGDRTGWRIGVNGVWGNMGVAVAAPITAYIAQHVGWRAAFWMPGLVSIVIGLAYALHVRASAAKGLEVGSKARRGGGMQPGWQRVMLVLAVTTTFGGVVFSATTNTMPKVFAERMTGFSLEEAMTLVALVYAGASFIQLVVGRAVDKWDMRPVFMAFTFVNVIVLWFAVSATGWPMFGLALVLMFLIFGQIPITDTLVARYTPDGWRSRVLAFKYVLNLGFSAGAMLLIGNLHKDVGFTAVFQLLTVCAGIVFVATLFLPGLARRVVPVPAE